MDVKKTKEQVSTTIKMLVYGPSGIGKTMFASTAPKPLFLDAEGGLLSIADKDIDYIKVDNFNVMKEVYKELLTKPTGYATIVIDSLTEVAKKSMDSILGQSENSAVEKDVANQHDWLQNIEQVRRMIRSYRDLPYNVIFTCLARDEKSELSGGVSRKPAVSAKSLSDDIVGYFDIVGYLDVDAEDKRWVLTQPYTTKQGYEVFAKVRGAKLDKFEAPDFSAIYTKVMSVYNNPVNTPETKEPKKEENVTQPKNRTLKSGKEVK